MNLLFFPGTGKCYEGRMCKFIISKLVFRKFIFYHEVWKPFFTQILLKPIFEKVVCPIDEMTVGEEVVTVTDPGPGTGVAGKGTSVNNYS